ncbi:MAG: hypothetical protein HOC91_07220 [Nitrospinaceae bacterium]|jgi:hypothetical protein|nr:hypothetical protein [Nitrospinaceae bacterium]MBT3433925.1 hypothetical protein [Nitrospinaceae bacterium]MBT3821614.1 hypothetical protein [Nitrospinaceae bacterium]MBT4093988.1 hypothetical protein [Nitrospinaceae bacterium]MBT4430288.1 hypothetical protein [Nitrospinaceae bacterium]
MSAFSKISKKFNIYGVLFGATAGVIAALLGIASVLIMLDMLGISIP